MAKYTFIIGGAGGPAGRIQGIKHRFTHINEVYETDSDEERDILIRSKIGTLVDPDTIKKPVEKPVKKKAPKPEPQPEAVEEEGRTQDDAPEEPEPESEAPMTGLQKLHFHRAAYKSRFGDNAPRTATLEQIQECIKQNTIYEVMYPDEE